MSGSIWSWSTTAGSNDSADGDINWTEGQNAKTVNNSARQMMGRVAEILLDIGGQGTVGGTANAITLTLNSSFTALSSGLICSLKPTNDNTGAVTLNVNGIGAKAIRKFDTTGEVALASGDLQAGNFYSLIYDSAANSSAGAWIVLNQTLANVLGPSSATDLDIAVFDGTTGKLIKNGGSKIADLMPKSGGTFTGAITAPGVTSSVGNFVGAASAAVLAPSSSGGVGYIRPNGAGSTTGQLSVASDGKVTASGSFQSSTANAVLTTGTAGTIWLEPNPNSATGATTISSNGTMKVGGNLTIDGDSLTVDGVAAALTSQVIGLSQTWQDVKASRALSTAYQNTTGKPIMVYAEGGSSSQAPQVSADGSTWIDVGEGVSGNQFPMMYVIVPNGHYYRINGTGSAIRIWAELR